MTASTADLPAGIVTFVFTDIEGSTRLFYSLGEGYSRVLERHRQILREAWSAHHGHEMSVEGDAFFVAFERAGDAVRACIAAQRALLDEAWPANGRVLVRMGIHTGLATPHAGDYVALAVHQAARIVAAGHGGQILVSEQTAERVQATDDLDLRPVGRYRLRDFDQPERVFLVFGDGLPTEHPAIRALPADGHNLVRQPDPTIGRDEMVARVAKEIHPHRLTTLVGPGGVGKSRVAGDIGVRIAPAWVDGVWRVDLAAVTEPGLAAAVSEEVGVPSRPGSDRWTDLAEHLARRKAVLLLDNCEHLVVACQQLIGLLFDSCEGVGVLATSREPIHIPGELLWPVPPLPLPAFENPTSAEALGSPAVQLFVERGAAVRPGFALDDRNTATVVSICQHRDGLPLSLELAAANLAVQSPAEILTGLEDRSRLLRSRDRELLGGMERNVLCGSPGSGRAGQRDARQRGLVPRGCAGPHRCTRGSSANRCSARLSARRSRQVRPATGSEQFNLWLFDVRREVRDSSTKSAAILTRLLTAAQLPIRCFEYQWDR